MPAGCLFFTRWICPQLSVKNTRPSHTDSIGSMSNVARSNRLSSSIRFLRSSTTGFLLWARQAQSIKSDSSRNWFRNSSKTCQHVTKSLFSPVFTKPKLPFAVTLPTAFSKDRVKNSGPQDGLIFGTTKKSVSTSTFDSGMDLSICGSIVTPWLCNAHREIHAFIWGLKNGFICAWRRV